MKKFLGLMLLLFLISIGLAQGIYRLKYGAWAWSDEGNIKIIVMISGQKGTPIKDALVRLEAPYNALLGFSNADGKFERTISVPLHKSLVISAEGTTFKIKKTVFPSVKTNQTYMIMMNPIEAQKGQITLTRKLEDPLYKAKNNLQKEVSSKDISPKEASPPKVFVSSFQEDFMTHREFLTQEHRGELLEILHGKYSLPLKYTPVQADQAYWMIAWPQKGRLFIKAASLNEGSFQWIVNTLQSPPPSQEEVQKILVHKSKEEDCSLFYVFINGFLSKMDFCKEDQIQFSVFSNNFIQDTVAIALIRPSLEVQRKVVSLSESDTIVFGGPQNKVIAKVKGPISP